MTNQTIYITAAELAEVMGVSSGHAYKLIREMNAELKKQGYLTIAGKLPRAYLPDFLYDMLKEYCESLYGIKSNERIFPFTKHFLHHEMDRGCKKSGVKNIRLHDIRHSHCALLYELGIKPA